MAITPQAPDDEPQTLPGDVPQGPQETNPDADDEPDVPLDSGQQPDAEVENSDDAAPGQMPASTNTEVGA